jgi:hypothetical protein
MWSPLIVAFLLTLSSIMVSYSRGIRRFDITIEMASFTSYFLFVVIALYSFLASVALAPFNCKKLGENTTVLVSSAEVTCFDSAWRSHLPEAVIFLLEYFLFCPLYIAWIMYKFRKLERIKSRFGIAVRERTFKAMVQPYRKVFYYWESVTTLKRVSFVFCFILLDSFGYFTKIWVAILILFGFAWLESIAVPYSRRNWAKVSWNFILVIILLCQGLIFEAKSSDSKTVSDGGISFMVAIIIIMILVCLLTNVYNVASSLMLVANKYAKYQDQDSVVALPFKVFNNLSDDDQRSVVTAHNEGVLSRKGALKVNLSVVHSCLASDDFKELMSFQDEFIEVHGRKRRKGASVVPFDGKHIRAPSIVSMPFDTKIGMLSTTRSTIEMMLPPPEVFILDDEEVDFWGVPDFGDYITSRSRGGSDF